MIPGNDVFISALNIADKSIILKWVNNPELKSKIGTIYPISDIEHEKWFSSRFGNSNEKIFGIISKKDGCLIGIIGLKNIDFINRHAELYIYIGDNQYLSKGLGTDAIQTLVDFSFDQLNLHKVYLNVFDYNEKAIKVYERVGFAVEGVLKDALYRDGQYHDVILMGRIKLEQ